jgi:glycosyltransferase involved in cell wall biosynthesis
VKVLLLHQHFNTPEKGGPLRSYYLVRALAGNGIRAIIITAYNGTKYKVETAKGLEVHYLPVGYHNSYGFYKRTRAFLRYMLRAVALARKFHDVALCYAISVPLTVGLAAMAIKALYRIPYIFEVGDLWPDAPVEMGFVRNRSLIKILYSFEKRIYKNAAAVVALSGRIRENIERKVPGIKVHVVENMSDNQFFMPGAKYQHNEKRFGTAGKFIVSYIGAVGYANGLEHFIECAAETAHTDLPIHFFLCGDGAMLGHLNESIRVNGLTNISIVPFQNRQGVKEILNVTDATFISYRAFPILETGSPNKFFDGLAAGKLIVINFNGWIRDEIENNECGIFIDRTRPHDFAEKIKVFVEDPALLKRYQRNARLLAERKYDRTTLSKRLTTIVQNAVSDSKH